MAGFQSIVAARPSAETLTRRLGDAGLAACLFVVPLCYGGRHDLGFFLYALAVAIAAVGVFAHAAITGGARRINAAPIAVFSAAVALLLLQLIPLPAGLYDLLAPYAERVLPLWRGVDPALAPWRTLSLTPTATREGLALLVAHGLLFATIAKRVRDADDIRRIVTWVAAAAVGAACLGLAHYALGEAALLGLYDHPLRKMDANVAAPFANKNNLAQMMALGVGPLALLAVTAQAAPRGRSRHDWRRTAAVVAVALVVVVALATRSRSGVAALAAAAAVAGVVGWRAGLVRRSGLFGAAGIALAALLGVSAFGYGDIANRLDDLATADMETLDAHGARRAIWAANIDALAASPFVGFGAGSHRDVYPLFLEAPFPREFTHAESGYLQVASETGAAGIALLVAAIGLVGWWIVRGVAAEQGAPRRALWVAIAPAFAASLVQSVGDFVWYTPSLLAVVVVFAACAMRLDTLRRSAAPDASSKPRRARRAPHAFATACVATLLASLSVGTLLPAARGAFPWDRYLGCSIAMRGALQDATTSDAETERLRATVAHQAKRMTELLDASLAVDPADARANLRMASRLLQRFAIESAGQENGMAIELVRGAATGGGFADHAAMLAWLDRAFGERARLLRRAYAHARLAARLAPLQGEAYVFLAKLAFLDPSRPDVARFVDQALLVRPYDGGVLFEAGRQRQVAGDPVGAAELWRRSARRPGTHQRELVALLAGLMPAEVFIDALDPGYELMQHAIKRYRRVGDEADLVALAEHARRVATEAERDADEPAIRTAYRWRLLSETLRAVDRHAEAVEASRRAEKLAPHHFWIRLELAAALHDADLPDDADRHIRWCLARRPDIRYLHQWLKEAAKNRTLVEQNRRRRTDAAPLAPPAADAAAARTDSPRTTLR